MATLNKSGTNMSCDKPFGTLSTSFATPLQLSCLERRIAALESATSVALESEVRALEEEFVSAYGQITHQSAGMVPRGSAIPLETSANLTNVTHTPGSSVITLVLPGVYLVLASITSVNTNTQYELRQSGTFAVKRVGITSAGGWDNANLDSIVVTTVPNDYVEIYIPVEADQDLFLTGPNGGIATTTNVNVVVARLHAL